MKRQPISRFKNDGLTLEEPNVLLLDMPEYALDDEDWQPREEVLRIGDSVKARLGLKNEIRAGCQPYVLKGDPEAAPTHTLRLRYEIQSKIDVNCVQLGIEDLANLKIHWNGADIAPVAQGYVDESIAAVALGQLGVGVNVLEIKKPFGKATTVEACYLLGDFGVHVRGRETLVTQPVRELAFGDWTTQGLAFYGGNVVYHAQAELPGGPCALEATHFAQPVLGVALDGNDKGLIAISPWRAELGAPAAGLHRIDITAYGNRANTFDMMLHNCDYAARWNSPERFRSEGCHWTYEYRLQQSGIIVTPRVIQKMSAA